MTIDVERIKEYNKKYKESQSKVMNLQAELDMNNREIDRLCKELSTELGIEITRENVENIYEQKVQAINSSLELGENILKRIENDEKGLKESSALESELKTQPVNNPNMGNVPQMNPIYNGQMPQMQNVQTGINVGGQMNPMNTASMGGFDSIGGMPQMEIKADEVTQPINNGVKNPFISQAMGTPVIPQMFSRTGENVPSLNESDFDSI